MDNPMIITTNDTSAPGRNRGNHNIITQLSHHRGVGVAQFIFLIYFGDSPAFWGKTLPKQRQQMTSMALICPRVYIEMV